MDRVRPQRSRVPAALCAGWLGIGSAVVALAPADVAGQRSTATGALHGTVTCHGVRDCTGAVVYVERVPGQTYPRGPEAVIDQTQLTFVPHVLTVVTGTPVVFRNNDAVWHNVFSTSPAKRFNLGNYPKGVDKRLTMDKPGVVALLCNVHPEMSAFIVVADTPFAVSAAPDGRYEMRGLPEGTFNVVAWRETLKAQRASVSVRPSATQVLDFSLRR